MKSFIKIYFINPLFFALLINIILLFISNNYYNNIGKEYNSEEFEKILHNKINEGDKYLRLIENGCINNNCWDIIDSTTKEKPKDVEVLIYNKDSIEAWTYSALPKNHNLKQLVDTNLVLLSNTICFVKHRKSKQKDIFLLIKLKTKYKYQNSFLNDEYGIKLSDADAYSILNYHIDEPNSFEVNDDKGKYLCTIRIDKVKKISDINYVFLFLILTIVIFIRYIQNLIIDTNVRYKKFILFFISLTVSIGFYILLINKAIFPILFTSDLFSPIYFGANFYFPNLGCLFIFSLLLFVQIYIGYKYINVTALFNWFKDNYILFIIISSVLLLLTFVFWFFINYISILIIYNSNISPPFFNSNTFNLYSFIIILVIVFLWLSSFLIYNKYIKVFAYYFSLKTIGIITIFITCFLLLIYLFTNNKLLLISSIMFFIVNQVLLWVVYKYNYRGYNIFVLFVSIYAIYAVIFLYNYSVSKEKSERCILIDNLSEDLAYKHDPLAEMILIDTEEELAKDTVITKMFINRDFNIKELEKYYVNHYLNEYLSDYNVQLVACSPDATLELQGAKKRFNCYSYFYSLINSNAEKVNKSNHYYRIKDSKIYTIYFGVFTYLLDELQKEVTLYVELSSKPLIEGKGYPSLLIKQSEEMEKSTIENYSYAKYTKGKLNYQQGKFTYPINFNHIDYNSENYSFFNYEGFSHLYYKSKDNDIVIISRPEISAYSIIVGFSLIFISFFIVGGLIIMFLRINKVHYNHIFSVQERIQLVFIGLIFTLLFVIAGTTVWLYIARYEQRNSNMLIDKVQSIISDLTSESSIFKDIENNNSEMITYRLRQLSNVFHTDINIYNLNGSIISTSRPELFNNGLLGDMMNGHGYYHLKEKGQLSFIHKENIGEMIFLAAYLPLLDDNNEVIAYINVPYFVASEELQTELSSLIMGIINFYMLFIILIIALTVVLARRITTPLIIIQNKLSGLKLEGRNEKIKYKGQDEIGQLVKEYNRMVDELESKAALLASSQREFAWREMARQIAHEIKNTLTPMKLSIQYLERAAANKDKGFDRKLKQVSKTLIGQIDTLSNVASNFSKFAKIPSSKQRKVDLVEAVNKSVILFMECKEAELSFETNNIDSCFIYADPEQLTSIFNNLIKNALQAIEKSQKGIIDIIISKKQTSVVVEVKDNGRGMDTFTQNRIFEPNFTTKSSGTGLGLSIVKSMVNINKGKIWFNTEFSVGTSFFVEFNEYIEK